MRFSKSLCSTLVLSSGFNVSILLGCVCLYFLAFRLDTFCDCSVGLSAVGMISFKTSETTAVYNDVL